MSGQSDDQIIQLKKYLEKTSGAYNPEQSLHNALKAAKAKNATRDIFTLFTGWVWVLFAGLGASLYTEASKRKHSNLRKKTVKTNSNHSKK